MKAVILAGGLGTRLAEETEIRPKPMVEIGGKPILWHILKGYSQYGVDDFIICCGYKSHLIKEYFCNYLAYASDLTVDLSSGSVQFHKKSRESWRVTLVDTGAFTQTGGRLRRVKKYIGEETFFFTYGDGVSNVDINQLLDFHRKAGVLATLTAVQPPGRFGSLKLENERVMAFYEKPKGDGSWINGGFFVLEPSALDLIKSDDCIWEQEPLSLLASQHQLAAYRHDQFWHPMDTIRDKNHLNQLWNADQAPWKVWA